MSWTDEHRTPDRFVLLSQLLRGPSAFSVPSPTFLMELMPTTQTSSRLIGANLLVAQAAGYDLGLGLGCDFRR